MTTKFNQTLNSFLKKNKWLAKHGGSVASWWAASFFPLWCQLFPVCVHWTPYESQPDPDPMLLSEVWESNPALTTRWMLITTTVVGGGALVTVGKVKKLWLPATYYYHSSTDLFFFFPPFSPVHKHASIPQSNSQTFTKSSVHEVFKLTQIIF